VTSLTTRTTTGEGPALVPSRGYVRCMARINNSARDGSSKTTTPPLVANLGGQPPRRYPTASRWPAPSDHLGDGRSLAGRAETGHDRGDPCGVKSSAQPDDERDRALHSESHKHLSSGASSPRYARKARTSRRRQPPPTVRPDESRGSRAIRDNRRGSQDALATTKAYLHRPQRDAVAAASRFSGGEVTAELTACPRLIGLGDSGCTGGVVPEQPKLRHCDPVRVASNRR
jgi:hypothetical protein